VAVAALALVGATLFDGTGAALIPDSAVVVRDGRIDAIGPRSRVTVPPEARVVDAAGKWLIPGLIDLHVHLDEVLTPGAFPLFGVTSVRDVGSRLVTLQRLRARAASGETLPRLFWMGRNIDEDKPSWSGAVAVKGPKEVTALLTDMQERQGVDGVKLYVNARPDVARAVIAEAHRRHMPVTGHLDATPPSLVARLGIDNLEHVFTLFSAELTHDQAKRAMGMRRAYAGVSSVNLEAPPARHLIETLAAHQVAVTATLSVSVMPVVGEKAADSVYDGWADIPAGWRTYWKSPYWSFLQPLGWKAADYQDARRAVAVFRGMVARLDRAGVPIVAGTDTPAPWVLPGAGLIHELEMLVEAGLSPKSALLAATGCAGAVLRKTGEVGTLQPGARADLVLLNADPVADIRHLRRMSAVYLGGAEVDRPVLRNAFQNVAAPPSQKPAA
jgi:imidazolonepropionase-like amidohydrolase